MPRSFGSSQVTFLPLIQIWPSVMSSRPAMAVEQRGLAAARRAEQHDELALLDVEVEVLQHLETAEGRRRGRGPKRAPSVQPFTAPAAMPRTNSLPETK